MFFINIIKSYREVVAICDSELLGKKFEEENFQLDLKENFYKSENSEPINEEKLRETIKNMSMEDATFNIVGKNAVRIAIEGNIVNESDVKKIEGVPYAMVFL